MEVYDTAIIGGGPGGYVAAIKAAQLGKRTVLIEKAQVGGVCLHSGCIPTKALLKSVTVLEEIKKAKEFGITVMDQPNISLDLNRVQARKQQVVRRLAGGVKYLLTQKGVALVSGTASFAEGGRIKVNDEIISARDIIIASGSTAVRPPIPVRNGATVITSEEALNLTVVPPRITVIGGGAVGIEFAYIFNRMGSKVTVIEMLDTILPRVDEEVAAEAAGMLKGLGINIITGAQVTGIDGAKVNYELNGQEKTAEADLILLAVGRVPSTEELNLEAANIKMNGKAIAVDDHLRTSIPNIYAIGDVNGKVMLAHTASAEALVAVENICGGNKSVGYQTIPQCVYINPELAAVGLTEKEAQEKYGPIRVGKFPLSANGKAMIEGETKGFIKVIVHADTGKILGVHIMGRHATDLIAECSLAMGWGATADLMTVAVHPHPTVSEIIPEAFHAALGQALHYI